MTESSSLAPDPADFVSGGTIWHYTTQTGLLGILRSKRIWATDTAMLNDSTEIVHGFSVVDKTVTRWLAENRVDDAQYKFIQDALGQSRQRLGGGESGTVVVCASIEGDDLAQWRAYSGDQGYAIGFSPIPVPALVEQQENVSPHVVQRWSTVNLGWARVIYDPIEQRAMVEKQIHRVLATLAAGATNVKGLKLGQAAAWHFTAAAAYLKNEGFKGEREVRQVYGVRGREGLLKVRESRAGLTLYAELAVASETDSEHLALTTVDPLPLPITQIRVGPGTNMQNAARALKRCLPALGYEGVEVLTSDVPYR